MLSDVECQKKRGTGRKHLQLCVVYRYGAPLCAFNLLILEVLCRVQGVGSVSSFSAQPHFLNAPLGSTVALTTSVCPHYPETRTSPGGYLHRV